MRLLPVMITAILLSLSGCSNDIVSEPKPALTAPASLDPAEYQLTADDKLHIAVFGEEKLTGDYVVAADGTIAFPLINSVKVAGLTTDQVRDQLTRKLGESFIANPRVTVAITEYRPFYVLGEVNSEGQYPYRPGMTVLAAIATARGFTYRADKSQVLIQHQGETQERLYPLTPSLKIQPGDTIRLKERFF